jgi:hypothetical protein
MIRRIISILILMLFLTACAGSPATVQAPAATEAPEEAATSAPEATEAPATEAATEPSAVDPGFLDVPATSTSAAPIESALPTLDLPTEAVNAPAQMVWDGTPTYLGESLPGYAFRVTYDPDLWALTTDQFGFPALAHRQISACVISVTSGRGLPRSMTVEHEMLTVGELPFDVGRVSENGILKFVTYTGGDGTIITAFEVSFTELADECLLDAETVISTLRSVPVSQATPSP